ncbi:MAG: hypothetical protein AAF763_16665 [Pseudomonadota bacterium]
MIDAVIDAPFGRVVLSARDGTPVAPSERAEALAKDMPRGMRLDHCLVAGLKIGFGTGEPVEAELSCALAHGMEAFAGNGEGLAAWTIESPDLAGAFAIRELDWLERTHSLEVVSYANAKAGLRVRLRAATPRVVTLGFAAAWTHDPASEADELAPWFAVDRVLPF